MRVELISATHFSPGFYNQETWPFLTALNCRKFSTEYCSAKRTTPKMLIYCKLHLDTLFAPFSLNLHFVFFLCILFLLFLLTTNLWMQLLSIICQNQFSSTKILLIFHKLNVDHFQKSDMMALARINTYQNVYFLLSKGLHLENIYIWI